MASLLESITIDAPEDYAIPSNASTPNIKVKDSSSMNGREVQGKVYDPSMPFILEIATSLAIRDEDNMRDLSAKIAEYCTEILRQRKHLHPILVERTLIYLMALKKRGHETVQLHWDLTNCRVWIQELVYQRPFDLFNPLNHHFSKVWQFRWLGQYLLSPK